MFTVSEKLILFILLGLILDQIFTYIISKALVYSDTCVSYMYRHEVFSHSRLQRCIRGINERSVRQLLEDQQHTVFLPLEEEGLKLKSPPEFCISKQH